MRALLKKNLPKIILISPGYNCANIAPIFINSLITQNYTNWECYLIDDASIDATLSIWKALTSGDMRFHIIHNEVNIGSLNSRDYVINHNKYINDDDICVIMDADDWFGTKYALELLVKEYLYRDILVTTSRNLCLRDGLQDDGAIYTSRDQLLTADKHMFSLFSFTAKLWRAIPLGHMIDPRTGEYYMMDSDTCYTFPILYQAGPEHHQHLFVDNYIVYNNIRPICDDYKYGDQGHKDATKLILKSFHDLVNNNVLPKY